MIGRLQLIAFDTPDVRRDAAFYAALADLKEVGAVNEEWLTMAGASGPLLAFQLAPDHVAPRWPDQAHPQQLHTDWVVGDLAAEVARAESLGATRLPGGGDTFTVMADPAGHPFCLCQGGEPGSPVTLADIAIDCPDGAALAAFYADLLGMKVTYEGPEGAAISSDDGTVMFQNVANFSAPRWPDPAHPQQAHLDVEVADLDEGEEKVLALGATKLDGAQEGFRVYADLVGHPFCLVD
jgi:catechol 2,3-dioxygenase-like lactoylglutathione lyase family enzyme